MRSLTQDQIQGGALEQSESVDVIAMPTSRKDFEQNRSLLKERYHSRCLFNREHSIIPELCFWFDDSGKYHGEFNCTSFQQGYDAMVHGGVIASVVDASMAQCLMGHGVAGYTTKLTISYRKPVLIRKKATLTTRIKEVRVGCLYILKCDIFQDQTCVVQGTGSFYRVNKTES